MKKQLFRKWEPLVGIHSKLYVVELCDSHQGLRILLRSEGDKAEKLTITFKSTLTYRNIDEGDLIATLHVKSEGLSNWSLYTVTDSEYVGWFNDESENIHEHQNVMHYAIYTPGDCIDILTVEPPGVEWSP